MKLYYSKGACSLAVRIILHELNISCEFESVNLQTKETASQEKFLKINPKGSVPVLVLDNKQILTENAVIQQYLAETFHGTSLLPEKSDFNHYRVLEWLNFISTDLHKSFSPFFNPKVPDDLKNTVFKSIIENKLNYIEEHLHSYNYLVGETFTLPDSYLFVILRWALHFKMISLESNSLLMRYINRLKEHPSVERALKEEGLLVATV
jgi:glutathione S-transferase